CFRETSELNTLIADVERVASKSYQRGLGVGFFDNAEIRQRLQLKATKGWLRGYVLYIKECPCAFWIGDINGKTFGSDYVGYDPDFASYSPGMYLIMKVVEGFCDRNHERVTEVDFATGHAEYKQALSNQEHREVSVYIFAPTLKGIGLNLTRTLVGGVDQTIKKTLARTSLLRRIKKSWRNRVKPKALIDATV